MISLDLIFYQNENKGNMPIIHIGGGENDDDDEDFGQNDIPMEGGGASVCLKGN